MPDSLVAMSEGAGKNLHTFQRVIGLNTVEDQVVLAGHPYEAAYFIDPGALASTATANSHLIQIMAGAALNVYIHRIVGYMAVVPAATTAIEFQLKRLSTAGTGGTAGVVATIDAGDAAAGATSMVLPTVKGSEGVTLNDVIGVLPAAFPTSGVPPIVFDFDYRGQHHLKVPRIAPGVANGLCVKNLTGLATSTLLIVATITEANFA